MLKNRILTTLLCAPLIMAAMYFLPVNGFAVFWAIIILIGAYEWAALCGLSSLAGRIGFTGLMAGIMVAAKIFAPVWAPGELPIWFYGPASAWWLIWGIAFRQIPEKLLELKVSDVVKQLVGVFILTPGWVVMVWLHINFSPEQALYLVLLIWVADIAAYFAGRQWGVTKLAPAISPGKTTEGVYGALAASGVFALIMALTGHIQGVQVVDFVFLSLVTVAISVCGDLFESLAKRLQGVKDSGVIFPGHGGMLDRIDSLLAAMPVFYMGSLLLGLFLHWGEATEPDIIMMDPSIESTAPMEVPTSPDDTLPSTEPTPEEPTR